jgi:putative hemolysin
MERGHIREHNTAVMEMKTLNTLFWIQVACALIAAGATAQVTDNPPSWEEVEWISNPAPAYCEDLGYEYAIVETPEGQLGVCRFSETENATDYDFLTGKDGQEHSYCARRGLQMKTIDDPEKCQIPFSNECAVCVGNDGFEVEVTKLMEGDKKTTGTLAPAKTEPPTRPVCGNGVCGEGESESSCPADCEEGGVSPLIIVGTVIVLVTVGYLISKTGGKKQ